MREYRRLRIPAWDELFAAGDRVVSAYTLEAERPNGEKEEMEVMAVWRIQGGKVGSLREVDVPHERR